MTSTQWSELDTAPGQRLLLGYRRWRYRHWRRWHWRRWHLELRDLSQQRRVPWQVTASIAAGNTAFISYSEVQDTLTNTSGQPVPLADYSSLTTSYASTLPAVGSSDGWAAGYAIWLGDATTNFSQQVLVWTANHGQVPSGGDIGQVYTDPTSGAAYEMWVNWNSGVITLVPRANSTSGSFNIYDLAEYLTQNGFSSATGINQVAYGFVLASTSGANETFAVSNFKLAGTGDGKNGAPGTE